MSTGGDGIAAPIQIRLASKAIFQGELVARRGNPVRIPKTSSRKSEKVIAVAVHILTDPGFPASSSDRSKPKTARPGKGERFLEKRVGRATEGKVYSSSS
jgi:hypothetical protein